MKQYGLYAALAVAAASGSLFASVSFVNRFPNCSSISCNTCHGGTAGSNALYNSFVANGRVWNAALARLDSDGDGYANGVELQDSAGTHPNCASSGDPAKVTDPTNAASHPAASAAVELAAPGTTALLSVFPNPAAGRISVQFNLGPSFPVTLRVYDSQGRLAADLDVHGLSRGPQTAIWNAAQWPQGIYFVELQASGKTCRQKIVLMK